MLPLLHILAGILLVATLLPLSRAKAWWIRALDFPRAQIAFGAALVLIGYLWQTRDLETLGWAGVGITAGVLLYQGWWILPFTPFFHREVAPAPVAEATERLRIMSTNVLMTNQQAPALKAVVRSWRPDVLLVVENNSWWDQQLAELGDYYPHVIAHPLENLYGMSLYSRWPLEGAEVKFLVEPDKPSIHTRVIMPGGLRIRLVCLHPAPPAPGENSESAERDAELILVARELAEETEPVIVTGDLNDVAWSRTTRLFRKISRLLDPRVGRGLYNTFHASYPVVRWPVDHLFHSRHFTLARLARLPRIGSDHFPIFAELVVGGGHANEDALEADAEDHEEAREELAAAGEKVESRQILASPPERRLETASTPRHPGVLPMSPVSTGDY